MENKSNNNQISQKQLHLIKQIESEKNKNENLENKLYVYKRRIDELFDNNKDKESLIGELIEIAKYNKDVREYLKSKGLI